MKFASDIIYLLVFKSCSEIPLLIKEFMKEDEIFSFFFCVRTASAKNRKFRFLGFIFKTQFLMKKKMLFYSLLGLAKLDEASAISCAPVGLPCFLGEGPFLRLLAAAAAGTLFPTRDTTAGFAAACLVLAGGLALPWGGLPLP